MKKSILLVSIIFISMVFSNCTRMRSRAPDTVEERFEKGMILFEKKKWTQAQENFDWIILNNPASSLVYEAQFYYAECLFNQKLYIEAQVAYEGLLRRWSGTAHMVEARYRIVHCLVSMSPSYYRDQTTTLEAIDELQSFIDDFPDSEQRAEAEQLISELRLKIAHKNYESGRQYLKWRQTESARIYFNIVLSQYYDTFYADQARVGVVLSYLLEEDIELAQNYLIENSDRFSEEELLLEAQRYIDMAEAGKYNLSFYIRLYR